MTCYVWIGHVRLGWGKRRGVIVCSEFACSDIACYIMSWYGMAWCAISCYGGFIGLLMIIPSKVGCTCVTSVFSVFRRVLFALAFVLHKCESLFFVCCSLWQQFYMSLRVVVRVLLALKKIPICVTWVFIVVLGVTRYCRCFTRA